jgi:hypothetical protein
MNRQLVGLLLMLYPRPWRERYGTEVVRLTQDLIVTGETTPARGALNMMGAALAERGRALAYSSRIAVAVVVAALLAVAGSFYAGGHPRPPEPPSAAPVQAKLTRCVVWPEPIGGAVVPAKVKVALRVGTKPRQVDRVLVPVEVTVPDRAGQVKVPAKRDAGRVLCVLAVGGPGRKTLIVPSP